MTPDNAGVKPSERIDYSQITRYFKYCRDDDRVIEGIFRDHKIRFTQPAALNDPLEFNPIIRFKQTKGKYTPYRFDGIRFPSEEARLRTDLIESQLNIFGVLSLTKVPNSFDMWSRYANGHKGFLLGLKGDFNKHPSMRAKDGTEREVRKLRYVAEYVINVDDLVNADGVIRFADFNEELFYTKTSRWQEEKEYRMVRPLADHPDWSTKRVKCDTAHRDRDSKWLFDFPLECIEAVFFGACMPVAKKQRIWNACKGTSIQCLQAYVIRDQEDEWGHPGTVRFHKVGDWSEASAWDDLGLVFELGHEEEIEDPPIGIRSLEELPYYEVDKERVELHYRKEKARRNA